MARTTNLHEAAELLTPSNELSNIMRREELLIDMPWKQALLSVMELSFDPRAQMAATTDDQRARGLQHAFAASEHAGAIVRNHLMPLLEHAGPPRYDALTALAVLAFEPQTVKLLSEAGAAPLLLRELLRSPESAEPEEERQLAAYALVGLSAEPLGRAALLLEEPVRHLCGLLRQLLEQQETMPTALCFCLVLTLANLALHDVAASKMVRRMHGPHAHALPRAGSPSLTCGVCAAWQLAEGAAHMLVSLTASRVAILHPPSLLSALQARPAQRTRANLGGVAVRALINVASTAPGGKEAVLKAGGAERLLMLGWGTSDEGVQAIVREGTALLEGVGGGHAEATPGVTPGYGARPPKKGAQKNSAGPGLQKKHAVRK